MANRVVHFEIPATDIKRAGDFYTKAFGWEMQTQGPEYAGYVVAMTGPQGLPKEIKDIGINGGLYQIEKKDVNAYRCVIGVDDIKKTIEDVKNAGGKNLEKEITDIPGVGLFIKCEDTEGNVFSLLQPYPGEWMPKP